MLFLFQGILISWTKGFSASGCVGEDVVRLLREAANRKNVCVLYFHFFSFLCMKSQHAIFLMVNFFFWQNHDFRVVALVNDTVGTMMSCGYDDTACEIGLIVGKMHCI